MGLVWTSFALESITSTANGVSFSVANVSVSVPIYVVGPSLANELIGLGINQTLIRPINISQLPQLPNGSLIMIDWPIIGSGLVFNKSNVIKVNVSNAYFRLIRGLIKRGDFIIVYGLQSYSDSFGTFQVDFCISWAGVVDEDYNGYSVGSAELYNYINYVPNSGIYIKQLESFQDAYASYLVYQYLLGQISESQLPGDVEVIAGGGGGYNPAYWTNPDFTPEAMQCSSSTTYTVGVAIGTVSGSISYTYSCLSYTISVYGIPSTSTPLGSAAFNDTWIFTPQNTQAATARQSYGVESDGPTYMGLAYVPQ